MNTITNISSEKVITPNTFEKPAAKVVVQADTSAGISRMDTFKYSDRSQSDCVVYSKPSVTAAAASTNDGIYNYANYHSTSISLEQMAAQRANINCDSGHPIINSGYEAAAYSKSLAYLKNFTPIETYNHYSPGNIGRGSVENTIFTYDHQYFLYSLTNQYDSDTKEYYADQGYEIDAYLLMGIAYGESEAKKSSTNPFGELAQLSSASAEKAKNRAVQALQDCGFAKNESDARAMMESDPFYEKAARVLSFMDNGKDYNTPLNVNYQCLDSAMPNIERWRNAVASGSQNEDDYGYRWNW